MFCSEVRVLVFLGVQCGTKGAKRDGPSLQGSSARSEGWSGLETIERGFKPEHAAELRDSELCEELRRISRDIADKRC